MMIDKLKQNVMRHGMKLMTNPKVMKMMADPRVMNAITQGFAIKGQIQSQLEGTLRQVASALNLATREDIENLRRTLDQVEDSVNHLEKKVSPSKY
jgi:BMFP domain-containing protein YqiC